ncbi:MAG: GxxExxY protein [Mariniphaga sp.]
MNEKQISDVIIGCAIEVHKTLGRGQPDIIYRECLFHELADVGMKVRKEKPLSVSYEDVKMDFNSRMGLVVEDKVIVELKSVETMNDVHIAQALSYLKLSDFKTGLLINFNVRQLRDGIRKYG